MHDNASREVIPWRLDPLIAALLAATADAERKHALCALILEAAGALGVAVLIKNRKNQSTTVETVFPPLDQGQPPPQWLELLREAYSEILAETPQSAVLTPRPVPLYGIYVPLGKNDSSIMVLGAVIAGGRSIRLQNVFDTLQMGRSLLFLFDRTSACSDPCSAPSAPEDQEDTAGHALLQVIDILGEVYPATRFLEAALALCAGTASAFSCARVALGIAKQERVKVVALDQMEHFARGSRSIRLLEDAMQEALDQDKPVLRTIGKPGANPPGPPGPPSMPGPPGPTGTLCSKNTPLDAPAPSARPTQSAFQASATAGLSAPTVSDVPAQEFGYTRAAEELLAASRAAAVYTLPLRTAGTLRFALLLELDQEQPEPDFFAAVSLIGRLAVPKLKDLHEGEQPPLARAWRWLLQRTADIFGPRRTALKLGLAAICLLVVGSLLIRGELTVHAPIHLEGVYSYTHTAPMDSYLIEVNARPGDAVKKGDALGRLDDTELLMEIETLQSQRDIYLSQYRQLLQQGKAAESEIVQLEAQKTAVNLQWAKERLRMTRLTSSVDGFIVSEDLFPRLGQPVRRGQDLFEITDTADLRVVVRIGENDISDINSARKAKNMECVFTLTAYPDLRIGFDVERIHPFTTVEAGSNGFELRGRIEPGESDIFLRPGMEGHARITCGTASLFSLATRKLVNRIRMLWWRWV